MRLAQPQIRAVSARLLLVAALLVAVVSVVAGIPQRYAQLRTITPTAITVLGQLRPDDAQRLVASGLSVDAYAAYFTAAELLAALLAFAVASLIFWGRPHDWMAMLVAHNLIAAGAVLPIVSALESTHALWATNILGWRVVFTTTLLLLFLLFPDGRFVPRWTRWLALAEAGYTLLWLAWPRLQPPFAFGRGLTPADAPGIALTLGSLVIGVWAQVWRYRWVSTPLERQRTKWVVLGFVLLVVLVPAGIVTLTLLTTAPTGPSYLLARLAGPTLILIGFSAVALTIGISVLRYRLWDIDLLIRRTLVYTLLSGMLALLYFGSVVAFERLLRTFTGGGSQAAIVLSTLLIAALFGPLRGRVQRAIDRRFYRRKYDAARTLAAFGAGLRDEVDLDALGQRLAAVVDETMQPAHVGLWLPASAPDRPHWSL
jgi:hypothetical protein